ncbi:MAG: ATP-binding protein [Xanthomonadales bacterium]|nr:ATP-binding protein [Xanthomonadales bacterium]
MLNSKIGLKLTFGVALTILVVIAIFAYFNIQSDNRSLLTEVERAAQQYSDHLKADMGYDMLHNDRKRIQDDVRRIGKQGTIDGIRVFNKMGEVIYSSDSAEIGKMVDIKAATCFRCHLTGRPVKRLQKQEHMRFFRTDPDSPRQLGIINPIYNEPSCWTAACHMHPESQTVLGVLDVTMPLSKVDQNIRNSQVAIIILAVSAIIILSVIIGFLVRWWIDRPVQDLLMATRQVAGGNLGYRVEVKREDELGMLARSFNSMTDNLAEARLQLFQSDKLASMGRLAAGVAHEINNPLTAVLTNSSYLLKRSQGQSELQEDLQVIVSETIRCREIVKSLLDFARQTVPKKRKADINEIIHRAATVVENQLSMGQVELVMDLDEKLAKVTVDANQIQQVFINLMVNASDAIGEDGGTINISSRAISLGPAGTLQIKRALCRKRHDLVDRKIQIDGKPAISMRYKKNKETGLIHLNPMYGSNKHKLNGMTDFDKEVELMCPDCSASLMADGEFCPDCGSRIYAFEVPLKGLVQGCLKEGCGWHRWEQVDSSWNDEYVEVKVTDNGCGIPQEQLPKLFEPFSTTKGQKGTGLGLAVTWGIVDNHNGTISVESKLCAGTTFTIRIPVGP